MCKLYEAIQNALNKIGIDIIDKEGNYRDFIEVILELQETMIDLEEDQKDIIRKFFL